MPRIGQVSHRTGYITDKQCSHSMDISFIGLVHNALESLWVVRSLTALLTLTYTSSTTKRVICFICQNSTSTVIGYCSHCFVFNGYLLPFGSKCRVFKGLSGLLRACLLLVLQEAVSTGDPEMVQLVLQRRDYLKASTALGGVPELLSKIREVCFIQCPTVLTSTCLCT